MKQAGWMGVVAMVAGLAGVVAMAQEAPARPRAEGEWRGPGGGADGGEGMIVRWLENSKLAKEAGITDEQIAALKTKLDVLRKEQIDLRAELEKMGLEQARLVSAKSLDEAAVMASVDKTSDVHSKMARNRMKQLLIVKETLTPEQTEKIKEMIRTRIGRAREGAGHGDRERGPRREGKPGESAPPPPPPPPAP